VGQAASSGAPKTGSFIPASRRAARGADPVAPRGRGPVADRRPDDGRDALRLRKPVARGAPIFHSAAPAPASRRGRPSARARAASKSRRCRGRARAGPVGRTAVVGCGRLLRDRDATARGQRAGERAGADALTHRAVLPSRAPRLRQPFVDAARGQNGDRSQRAEAREAQHEAQSPGRQQDLVRAGAAPRAWLRPPEAQVTRLPISPTAIPILREKRGPGPRAGDPRAADPARGQARDPPRVRPSLLPPPLSHTPSARRDRRARAHAEGSSSAGSRP